METEKDATRDARRRELMRVRRKMARNAKRIDNAVWVHPGRHSGDPCVLGTRIPTRMVADYVWHGSYADLLNGYDLNRAQILVACWYEAEHGAYRKQWTAWVEQNFTQMWKSQWNVVPNPPLKESVMEQNQEAQG